MLTLLERNIDSIEQRLVLVAPPGARVNPYFDNVRVSDAAYDLLVCDMQRLRGGIYRHDEAIRETDLVQGRHQTPEDERSWHLLLVTPQRRITACVWYREHGHEARPQDLRVRSCPLAWDRQWQLPLWRAVAGELLRARQEGLCYAEVGGWAVAPENRCTSEGLMLALAAYSLGRIAGGALGMTTATVRHSSSTILRRIGGRSLQDADTPIPSYHDPRYGCEMELLRFDSRRPDTKYEPLIQKLQRRLVDVLVVAPTTAHVPQRAAAVAAA